MSQLISQRRVASTAVFLSFAWNIFLLIGVVINLSFVQSRAAGGHYTHFPAAIRVVYALQLVLVLYQAWIFKSIFNSETLRFMWMPKFFFVVGLFEILVNAASRSSNERLNVIPAVIITWAFWNYGVKKRQPEL